MRSALARSLVDALSNSQFENTADAGGRPQGPAVLSTAHHVAAALAQRDLAPGEPVHLTVAGRLPDLGALLGIWLAGGCAVPIHAEASTSTADMVRKATAARFSVDVDKLHMISEAAPPLRELLSEAALIIFTSGSTGRPKGVVVSDERLAAKLRVLARLVNLVHSDVVLVPLQLTFIFGIWVSLLGLMAGARLVLEPKFSRDLTAQRLEERASVLAAVPSMLRALLSNPGLHAPALRMVLTGGEAFAARLARTVQEAFPGAAIYNLYGLTETTSCDFCLTPSDQPDGWGTIGSPTEQVTFRMVAPDGKPAAPGTPGELQIHTPFMMLGYLDDPALTRSAFSEGFFRTGDLVRVRPDGRVEIVGRIKEIISRGGNKIAPLEIENLFCEHPDVVSALCVGVPDERLGEAIHVVIVPKLGSALSVETLRKWASARIERYKVPDAIHLSDELPVGSTGKTDRAAVARMLPHR
jgi:long-chain acyl-CoA synthetase